MSHSLYLDSNATTSVMQAAQRAALAMMECDFGNPSSTHSTGLVAKDVLEGVRRSAAALLGAGDGRLLFTSGATEAIQTAVLSALRSLAERRSRGQPTGRLLVYGATEHKAVPQALAHWNQLLGLNLELRALPVGPAGRHDLQTLARWLPETALLCTMAANNETGVVSDLAGLQRVLLAQPQRPLWLVDCVQALGKLPLDLQRTCIDYAPFSGHKLYAPKGVGMLYVHPDAPFTPLIVGGGQEQGLRSGTENMPGIAALGAVLDCLQAGGTFADTQAMERLRDRLVASLQRAFPRMVLNAPLEHALPTTLNFSVPGWTSRSLLNLFDAAGLRVSAGSACSAAKAQPSHVLQAMGLPEWQAASAVRLSFGPLTAASEVDLACAAIERCGEALARRGNAAAAGFVCTLASEQAVAPSADDDAALTLRWTDLPRFLERNPQAQLVDVRDGAEHELSNMAELFGRQVLHLPASMDRLESSSLVREARGPLVLICRSGNRSLQVARCLHARGLASVRHVHGGLALMRQ